MFVWYKKKNTSGGDVVRRSARNYIIGVVLAVIIGGVILFFVNGKEIIGTEELKGISAEEGMDYSSDGDNSATITGDGITASVFECDSNAEAADLFGKYCAEYPKEDAEDTKDIDFGDSYSKYSASGSKGVLIAVQINERVAVVTSDDASDVDEAEELFEKIVK